MKKKLQNIFTHYGLGTLLTEPVLLSDGYSHKVYQVRSEQGDFVIKKLHPVFVKSPAYLQRYRHSLQLAQALYDKQAPVNIAIPYHVDAFFQDQQDYYVVFPWLSGKLLEDNDVTIEHVESMTHLLVAIQTLHYPANKPLLPCDYYPELQYWKQLIADLDKLTQSLQPVIQKVWPTLEALSEQVPQYRDELNTDLVPSHGDLDPSNVMWRSHDDYSLIDWEWAGWMNRTQDCWAVALSWSRQGFCRWDNHRLQTFWQTYHVASPKPQPTTAHSQAAYLSLCAYWFEWVEWNIRRIMAPKVDVDETKFALETIAYTLETVHFLFQKREHFLSLARIC